MIFLRAWEALNDWTDMLFEKLEDAVGINRALFIWAFVGISLICIYCMVSITIIVMIMNELIDWLNVIM